MKNGEPLCTLFSEGQGGSCLLLSSFAQVICSRTKLSLAVPADGERSKLLPGAFPNLLFRSQGQKSALAGVNSPSTPPGIAPSPPGIPQAPAAQAREESRRCHSPPEGASLSLLGAAGLYRSVGFMYSFTERNLWTGLNLVRKGKKEEPFLQIGWLLDLIFPL